MITNAIRNVAKGNGAYLIVRAQFTTGWIKEFCHGNPEPWHTFFDFLAKLHKGKQAEIEVASLALGVQVESEWLALLGLVYDPKDDLVEVALDGVDHMIVKPHQIYLDMGLGGLMSIEIIDADGTKQIIKLRDPLTLPALTN